MKRTEGKTYKIRPKDIKLEMAPLIGEWVATVGSELSNFATYPFNSGNVKLMDMDQMEGEFVLHIVVPVLVQANLNSAFKNE